VQKLRVEDGPAMSRRDVPKIGSAVGETRDPPGSHNAVYHGDPLPHPASKIRPQLIGLDCQPVHVELRELRLGKSVGLCRLSR
jgi:hypothetical protein